MRADHRTQLALANILEEPGLPKKGRTKTLVLDDRKGRSLVYRITKYGGAPYPGYEVSLDPTPSDRYPTMRENEIEELFAEVLDRTSAGFEGDSNYLTLGDPRNIATLERLMRIQDYVDRQRGKP